MGDEPFSLSGRVALVTGGNRGLGRAMTLGLRKAGATVAVHSVDGAAGIAGYGTAKTGVLGLTHALAVELAGQGIQVNAILPGWFETDLTAGSRIPSGAGSSGGRRRPAGGGSRPTSSARPSSSPLPRRIP